MRAILLTASPTLSSLICQTILRQEYPEVISLEKKTTTALPGRAAPAYRYHR